LEPLEQPEESDPLQLLELLEPPEFLELPEQLAAHNLVRPYVITKGRTKSSRHLAIETLVSTIRNAHWGSAEVAEEFHSVRSICEHPRSVAEVAASLAVPLGVARVVLGDMADLGLVSLHDSAVNGDGRPEMALMERVLHGLRRM
jgi:hypothetical protein